MIKYFNNIDVHKKYLAKSILESLTWFRGPEGWTKPIWRAKGRHEESNRCLHHRLLRRRKAEKFKDVYVTDHQPVDAKLTTAGDEEDQDYFEYHQVMDECNSDSKTIFKHSGKKRLYPTWESMSRGTVPLPSLNTVLERRSWLERQRDK